MPLKTVTTAGTKVQLSQTRIRVARVTLLFRPSNDVTTNIYGGYAGEANNTGANVSSLAMDFVLSTGIRSITIGEGSAFGVDLSDIWLDSSRSGDGVVWFSEVS